ncbi:MAG: thiol:disulfide interchange protein DsbA/DsbL [Pseudomonadales bacterium]
MQLKTTIKAILFGAIFLPLIACAEQAAEEVYKAGEHYVVLPEPVKTRDPKKVEVVELFWYGCSHCYSFEPVLEKWASKSQDDVDFWRSPAMWRDVMVEHAKAFYAAKTLGILDKMHMPLFEALNVERRKLATERELADFFAEHGVDADKFKKAYNSFSVTSGVRLADSRARSYKITGTPEIVVNGKYRVDAKMAGGQQQMLDITDFLIAKERASL